MTTRGLASRGIVFGGAVVAWYLAACSGGGKNNAGLVDSGAIGATEAGVEGSSPGTPPSEGGTTLHLDGSGGSSSGGGGAGPTTSDKVDILIDIDNSASMGDKQDYLKAAIPDLIDSLVNPACVDATTKAYVGVSANGACAKGVLEYAPVRDMHIAIITSSLGARGGDACGANNNALPPFQNVLAYNDDQAHLINRRLTFSDAGASVSVIEGVVADATPVPNDEFLYWYPGAGDAGAAPGPGTPVVSTTQIESDVTALVGGAGVFGCGLESQLESWYR
ncbi:MAG: hypothetical protein ACRENE_07250, partial [Polyangiaceae bacterium]